MVIEIILMVEWLVKVQQLCISIYKITIELPLETEIVIQMNGLDVIVPDPTIQPSLVRAMESATVMFRYM